MEAVEKGSEGLSEKKEKILRAAMTLFSSNGFEAVSTRALAREAGVNIAMLSYYFGSKEKLYEAMIHYLLESKREDLGKIFSSQQSPSEKVHAMVDYYVDRVFSHGSAHKIFAREITMSPHSEICQEILDFFMENRASMKQIFLDGIEQGEFRQVDTEMTLHTLIASVHHLTYSPLLSQKMFELNFSEPLLANEPFKQRLKDHLKDLLRAHLSIAP